MLDLGNAGERLFVSSPPVVFPALGGGRQIERGKINHTVDAKSVRRSVLSALRRISLSSTGKEAKMNHESGYGRAHRQAEHIFRNLLPAHGMAVREGQIALCHAMLDALFNKEVLLCEAGVGIGKTLAYLVACVLWQQQRPAALVEPVVISTSSVTLQEAILREYLPFLSQVLLQEHIIQAPICAVVRKGKERFACDLRLQLRKTQVKQRGQGHDAEMRSLYNVSRNLDLDQAEGLSNFDRRLICVPEHCPKAARRGEAAATENIWKKPTDGALPSKFVTTIFCWQTPRTGRRNGRGCSKTIRRSSLTRPTNCLKRRRRCTAGAFLCRTAKICAACWKRATALTRHSSYGSD